ncbi:hypothetical protein DLAC_00833 [Tieghemostelium lacteum]|uniref:MRH domain-containing protein n=1 Tax=Tieghemostelium lacteum TaxID=361077 RepID=A0A152A746_TIELA|nr:hypothetical protein DLAC_00833 [Tieghemostelium lacteum]|eukprot:KYR02036.1 hypothetical protein DLAC_00833 [Tieghemostelium lacteum]
MPPCEYIDDDGRYYDFSGFTNGTYGFTFTGIDYGVQTLYFSICQEDNTCNNDMFRTGSSACMFDENTLFRWLNLGDIDTYEFGQLPGASVSGEMGATLNYTTTNTYGDRACLGYTIYTNIQLICDPNGPTTIKSGYFDPNTCIASIVMTGNDACPFQNVSSSDSEGIPFECKFLGNSVAVLAPNKIIECSGTGKTVCNSVDPLNQRTYMASSTLLLDFYAPGELQCIGENIKCAYEEYSCGFINGTQFIHI